MKLFLLALLCATVVSAGSPAAPLVQVTLYHESLCPDCIQWITQDLNDAVNADGVAAIMNVTLVPYGNARETQQRGQWVFTCQHGPRECQGNLIETCAIDYAQYNFATYWPMIYCMENSDDPVAAAQMCAGQAGLNWQTISGCVNSTRGNQLEHNMAVMTDALNPPHQYVPWVTLNGKHSTSAENNFLPALCAAYTGPKPAGCSRFGPNDGKDDKPHYTGCKAEF